MYEYILENSGTERSFSSATFYYPMGILPYMELK